MVSEIIKRPLVAYRWAIILYCSVPVLVCAYFVPLPNDLSANPFIAVLEVLLVLMIIAGNMLYVVLPIGCLLFPMRNVPAKLPAMLTKFVPHSRSKAVKFAFYFTAGVVGFCLFIVVAAVMSLGGFMFLFSGIFPGIGHEPLFAFPLIAFTALAGLAIQFQQPIRTFLTTRIVWRVCLVGVVMSFFLILGIHAQHETAHDLPNPMWGISNGGYTYDVTTGPPADGLLDTRPETIAAQIIHDYIQIGGTFPCVIAHNHDPVLNGQRCPLQRAVEQSTMMRVRIATDDCGDIGTCESAYVTYQIAYQDGGTQQGIIKLIPNQRKKYYHTAIHLDCWEGAFSSFDTYSLYEVFINQHIPLPQIKGLEFSQFAFTQKGTPTEVPACQP